MKISRALSSLIAVSAMFASAHAWFDYDTDGLAAREAFEEFWGRANAADVQQPVPQTDSSAVSADSNTMTAEGSQAGGAGDSMGAGAGGAAKKHKHHHHHHAHHKRAYDVLEDFYARSDIISELTTRELVEELENRLLRRETPATPPLGSAGAAGMPGGEAVDPALGAGTTSASVGGGSQTGQNRQEAHKKKHHHHHHHHKHQKPKASPDAQTGQTGQVGNAGQTGSTGSTGATGQPASA